MQVTHYSRPLIRSGYNAGIKKEKFLLHFTRLFVTLASPKLLSLGNAKEKRKFLLHCSRLFVTLPLI